MPPRRRQRAVGGEIPHDKLVSVPGSGHEAVVVGVEDLDGFRLRLTSTDGPVRWLDFDGVLTAKPSSRCRTGHSSLGLDVLHGDQGQRLAEHLGVGGVPPGPG